MLIGILTDAREASKVALTKPDLCTLVSGLGFLFHETLNRRWRLWKTTKVPRSKSEDRRLRRMHQRGPHGRRRLPAVRGVFGKSPFNHFSHPFRNFRDPPAQRDNLPFKNRAHGGGHV